MERIRPFLQKNKRSILNLLYVSLFILALVLTYGVLDRLFSIKTTHGIRQARDMYAQPEDTIDVVFLGSSHIHCDVNTALLWEEFGIAAYDYSAAEQPIWITYYYLKEICKYQDLKVVVVDLYSPARYKDDYQYEWLSQNLYGVRFSLNKIEMLLASCELEKIWEYIPSFAGYHDRYDEITQEDWSYVTMSKYERSSFKGYTPYYNVIEQQEPELTQEKSGGLTVKSEVYLEKIIQFTKENDIELFLIVAPYITTDEDETVYNRIKEIAGQYDINFNSTNYDYTEMGLDFETDFNDDSHLNYLGSCKFSRYLGEELKERFDIPDRRGDVRYESWDRHAEEINAEVAAVAAQQAENTTLLETENESSDEN